MKRLAPPTLTFFIVLLTWEMVVRTDLVSSYLLPAPTQVAAALIENHEEFLQALGSTVFSTGCGFLLSTTVGLSVAIIFSLSHWLYRAIYPYAIFFQTVPIIAIAPLLIIWLGYGVPAVVASSFIVSIFPMIASSLTGLRSTDPALNDLFYLYNASRGQKLWKLTLPFALPHILSGMRIVAGLAIIGAVVGEFMGGIGLGSVIDAARTQQRVDKVFAAIILTSFFGLLIIAALDRTSRWFLRHWHPSYL